jgi:hypothetical protein
MVRTGIRERRSRRLRHVLAGLGLSAVALAAAASPAGAATVIDPLQGAHPYQRWVERSEVPTPDVTLKLIETTCPPDLIGFATACTQRDTFTIWMNPEGATRARFYHELGHNFDYYELGRWASRQFREITGDDRPWRTKPGEIGLSPHEIFAEAYGVCALRRHIRRPVIQLPPIVIGPAEHDAICDLIRDAYKLEEPRATARPPLADP